MNRRDFLKTAGAGACLAVTGCSIFPSYESDPLPNIVLCMADDQGWGDMAYNGHAVLKTPHFDAASQAGLRFDRFYAAAPVCSPTRGSVLTGRHPNRFGCFKWGYTLRPQETTIAEALRTAGYATGHFGKWHLGSVRRGSPVNPGSSGFDEWFSAPNFFDNDPILSREGKAAAMQGESSQVTVDAALEFIRRQAKSGRPFLAVVWFGSPHSPHRALEEDLAPYEAEKKKKRHFYGEITAMDRAFGKLRQGLAELGIAGNTILWYTSDNGGLPGLGSTGGRAAKGSVYEGGLRVPAFIEWPARIAPGRITNLPGNTTDIHPTLLEIAGVDVEDQPPLDGISLAPLFRGSVKKRRKPMGFWQMPEPGRSVPSYKLMSELLDQQEKGQEPEDDPRLHLDAGEIEKQYPEDSFPGHAAWLDWPWKLHRIENQKKGKMKVELYNLADDPMEENDLAALEPERAGDLLSDLETWLVSVVQSLNGGDYR